MSIKDDSNPAKAQAIPTFTGMPVGAETVLRNSLNHFSGVITGIILIWLSKNGFNEHAANALGFSLSEVIGGLVASVLTGGATIAWGWWQSHRTQLSLVNNTIAAALTGVVPLAIASKATLRQAAAIDQSEIATVGAIVPLPPKPI